MDNRKGQIRSFDFVKTYERVFKNFLKRLGRLLRLAQKAQERFKFRREKCKTWENLANKPKQQTGKLQKY